MNTGTHPHQGGMVIMSQPGIRFIRPLGSPQPPLGEGLESQHARETQTEESESYVRAQDKPRVDHPSKVPGGSFSPSRRGDRLQRRMQPRLRKSRRRKKLRLTQEELAVLQKLRERNAAQWTDAVRRASRTPSIRAHLAAIVVWDYFFDKPAPHMRDRALLMKWMREWTPQNCSKPAVLARVLEKCGFPPKVAEARSRVEG